MSKRLSALLIWTALAAAQQVPDLDFAPSVGAPRFAAGRGPAVAIDAAHENFHTAEGRYQTFAQLLEQDGFRVSSWTELFELGALDAIDALVVSNALNPSQRSSWAAPSAAAFSDAEARAVEQWVRGGGALMLIADHQPFPGAAADLAARFGVEFVDAYALDETADGRRGSLTYSRAAGNLLEHEVTAGVKSVSNFGGSAFRVAGKNRPLMRLSGLAAALTADFNDPSRGYVGEPKPIGGWLQGATIEHGSGRVAVFAEAAMFSAQLSGPQKRPMGMNAPYAKDNPRLLLNVMRWLTETKDYNPE